MNARRFKPHPAYKDSGVEWLGEIPAHWELKRIRDVAESLQTGPFGSQLHAGEYALGGYPVINPANLRDGELVPDEDCTVDDGTAKRLAHHRLMEGDILFARRGELGRCGLAVRSQVGWLCGTGCVRLRVRRVVVYPRFLMRLLSTAGVADWLALQSVGATMQNLNTSIIGRIPIVMPPVTTQEEIAAFLDRETARIDALVAKKERLIELLQEKRTALITRAVTKGLDPTVPRKDSGVEWLGEIPAHWEVKPLKSASHLQTGLTLGKKYVDTNLTTRPYLRVANVQDGYFALDDIAEVELPMRDAPRYELRAGDVLMTEGGDFDKLGRGSVWEGQVPACLHQNHIFAVRPRIDFATSHYLALVMGSGYGRAYFTATSKQSTNLASTNSTKLRNLLMPMPSVVEQSRIVAFLDRETAKLDALIAKVRDAIDRLKELRTALISAAVTGKIDVREEAA
jgi:type I restriction enzyme S subunit